MRNASPFNLDFFVRHNVWPEVELVKLAVVLTKHVGIQRFTSSIHGVNITLKLGKHALTIYSPAEALKEVIEDVRMTRRIALVLKEIMREQRFITGRSNLGNKEHVI